MKSFKHSGDLGDIIYALPIVKALGGGRLYLNIHGATKFNQQGYKAIKPLVESQSYIESAPLYKGEDFDYDLDLFRKRLGLGGGNLTDWQMYPFGLKKHIYHEPWLVVPSTCTGSFKILISKSERYLNPNIDWVKLCTPYVKDAAFVGLKNEYNIFVEETGFEIPFVATRNFYELALFIEECKLFIGNCSAPYAIAEAMKKDCIQVTDWEAMTCIYERNNVKYLLDDTDY